MVNDMNVMQTNKIFKRESPRITHKKTVKIICNFFFMLKIFYLRMNL